MVSFHVISCNCLLDALDAVTLGLKCYWDALSKSLGEAQVIGNTAEEVAAGRVRAIRLLRSELGVDLTRQTPGTVK